MTALDRTEKQVARVIQGGGETIDVAAKIEELRRKKEEEDAGQ